MHRNNAFTVNRVHGAYCLRLNLPLESPTLFYAETPYGQSVEPLGAFHGQEMWVPTPNRARRLYFAVRGKDGSFHWAADTAVEIAGVDNFRDQGGYLAAGGKTVKWGRFFRCGGVNGMNPLEMEIYEGMRIKTILDYRAPGEAAERPDVVPAWTKYVAAPAVPQRPDKKQMTDMDMLTQLRGVHTSGDAESMCKMFEGMYGFLPFGNDAYQKMFQAMDSEETVPMIQHCSAGKDRTGIGCALLLLSLGVDEETVMQDYLLSAPFREEANLAYASRFEEAGLTAHAKRALWNMLSVSRGLLGRALDAIKERYPSFEDFFLEEYGVTGERLAHYRNLHTV